MTSNKDKLPRGFVDGLLQAVDLRSGKTPEVITEEIREVVAKAIIDERVREELDKNPPDKPPTA